MSPADLRSLVLALAIGGLGGLCASLAGLPLAWMLGPMLATMMASLAGLPLAVPASLRGPTVAVLGVLLGSGFDREVLERLLNWLPILLVLPFYVILVATSAFLYLRQVGRLDRITAWFSATPGGLGEMVVLGDRAGGDLRTIALVHSTRILLVVLTIPLTLALVGWELPTAPAAARGTGRMADLVVLLTCGIVGVLLGPRLRLPASNLLGPMLLSAAAHLLGLVHGAPPPLVVAGAQLVIGAQVGARFAGYPPRRIALAVLTGVGLTVLMLLLALATGWLLARATGLPLLLLLLALAPGGLAEMSLVALALTDDPALVAAVHIVRIALVVLLTPFLFRAHERLERNRPGG